MSFKKFRLAKLNVRTEIHAGLININVYYILYDFNRNWNVPTKFNDIPISHFFKMRREFLQILRNGRDEADSWFMRFANASKIITVSAIFVNGHQNHLTCIV
jgi:hypothetical protein